MDLSNENIIHIKENGIEYLQFRKLLKYKDIITHAYTLGTNRNFRTAKDDKTPLPKNEYEQAINNYKTVCSLIQMDYKNIVKTEQEHTNNILIVNNKINKNAPDINLRKYEAVDGLITNKKELSLTTTNADCILMLFFDPIKKVIANVHSGWKGTMQEISIAAVDKMIDKYNCNPQDIICCICPSIRKCHFEVEKDVMQMFYNKFNGLNKVNEIIEQKSAKKWNIDTVLINKLILLNKGLRPENIIDSNICSVCNSSLIHSYRVEKKSYGVLSALIALK